MCGSSDFAQAALGDIVFVDLPDVGGDFDRDDSSGSVETVQTVSDVYVPISGAVVEINEALGDEPGIINTATDTKAELIPAENK